MRSVEVVRQISVSEFKARCLSLVEDVARTGQPIVVMKRGKPLVRVAATAGVAGGPPQATLRGVGKILGEVEGPTSPASAWTGDAAHFRRGPRRARVAAR